MTVDSGFYSIIDYPVDGPDVARELVETFAEIQERWVRHHPGFRSARFLASLDGARVIAIVHWASEAHLRMFEGSPETEGLGAAIRQALDGLPGVTEPRMDRFRVLREVPPDRWASSWPDPTG
ncbi:antibiotic biosynthesis monooxygenase family protein [Micromonospora sp. NBC_01412]|uniref:antibiotic biosynthesis monooxygenase family protein n=1 Tax=Micromonospora sp. NBC_01412 TaxID=2903590 RepID=UPI0032557217